MTCQLSATDSIVFTNTSLVVNLTTKNNIPSGGYLKIFVPLKWSTDFRTFSGTILASTSTITCSNGVGILTNPSCTYFSTDASVRVSGLSSGSAVSGAVSFRLNSITTPPSTL
jgi:hypothetical protein